MNFFSLHKYAIVLAALIVVGLLFFYIVEKKIYTSNLQEEIIDLNIENKLKTHSIKEYLDDKQVSENNSMNEENMSEKNLFSENSSIINDSLNTEKFEADKNILPTSTESSENIYEKINEDIIEKNIVSDEKIDLSFSKYKTAMTTYFWVGEREGEDNNYISNSESYWNSSWEESFGGEDSPENRCGYNPCAFMPKENPFYFALPYGEYNNDGSLKESTKKIPWFNAADPILTLKNRWIEITYDNNICYAQWEDVGPFEEDDFDYVFGKNNAKNKEGVGAGLDISPAVFDCLKMKENDYTQWRFIEESQVPIGPWKEIITTSLPNWQ